MKRVEIIANQSVVEDVLDVLEVAVPGFRYTLFPHLHGRGSQGIRKGDDVWPEVNNMVLIFCADDEAARIERAVTQVKEHFPKEGVKVFVSPAG
jgi:nitrogen regulatory protein PII